MGDAMMTHFCPSAYPTTRRTNNLESLEVEGTTLGTNLLNGSLHINIGLLADTTEKKLGLANVRVIVATASEVLLSELVNTGLIALNIKAVIRRIEVATFLIAALQLAEFSAVTIIGAVLIAVARLITGLTSRKTKVRVLRHGSIDDGSGHFVDSLLDEDLFVELLEVLIGGLVHEHTLGGHERNVESGDGVSDLDRSARGDRAGGLEVVGHSHGTHLLLVTILASLTVTLDILLDVIEIILEGVASLGVDLSIVDPEVRVDISDVSTDGVIPVESEAALTNRGGGGDVHAVRKAQLVEDRASEASLDVEDEVLVHLLLSHSIDSVLHLLSIDVAAAGEADSTLRTVIIEEDKNVIIRARLKALATADASHVFTSEDLKEVLASHEIAGVILGDPSVHIRTVRLVDDLTLLRIRVRVSDIILHHNNDALVRDAQLVDNLISVADISLMTVVIITVAASDKNDPSLSLGVLLRKMSERISAHSNSKSDKSEECKTHLKQNKKTNGVFNLDANQIDDKSFFKYDFLEEENGQILNNSFEFAKENKLTKRKRKNQEK